jgi:predicted PurR-regulated permease PerM
MSESSDRRLGYAIIVGAAIIILIWGIRGLAGILNPILLASVVTVTLLPVPLALEKRGLKSGLALVATIVLVVLFMVGFAWFLLASIANMNVDLPGFTNSYQAQSQLVDPLANPLEQAAMEIMSVLNRQQFSDLFAGLLSIIATSISQVFLTLLIFIFMLYTALSLPDLSRLGIRSDSTGVILLISLTSDVRRYMTLTAFINLLVGIADGILLWIMGVPYAVLWGILAWVLGFIPAVGFWIALIPPVLLAYSLYGTSTALIIFAGYVVINGTAANFISPRVLGKGLSISPLVVFVSVFIWGWLLGAIGAILAIPLTMIIIAILESLPTTRWIARLMSYVPGSEEQVDAEAVHQARSAWERIRERLPTPMRSAPVQETEDVGQSEASAMETMTDVSDIDAPGH